MHSLKSGGKLVTRHLLELWSFKTHQSAFETYWIPIGLIKFLFFNYLVQPKQQKNQQLWPHYTVCKMFSTHMIYSGLPKNVCKGNERARRCWCKSKKGKSFLTSCQFFFLLYRGGFFFAAKLPAKWSIFEGKKTSVYWASLTKTKSRLIRENLRWEYRDKKSIWRN